jgi:hypothetical protein
LPAPTLLNPEKAKSVQFKNNGLYSRQVESRIIRRGKVNLLIRLKQGSWFRDIYQDTPQATLPADLHARHGSKVPLSFIENNLIQIASGTPELKIGRHLENGLVLDDLNVSRFHALITPSPDSHWYLKDLNSHNGTYLKRQSKITLCSSAGIQLQDGDKLIMGGVVLEVLLRPNPPE